MQSLVGSGGVKWYLKSLHGSFSPGWHFPRVTEGQIIYLDSEMRDFCV